VIIVGFIKPTKYKFPSKQTSYTPLKEILETVVDPKYYASKYIREKRKAAHQSKFFPSIWHENKGGHISSYPFSCALRANASYNYLLVNGERRLTPREMLRLQGFPDTFRIVVPESELRKQAGNAVPVNIIEAVLESILPHYIEELGLSPQYQLPSYQLFFQTLLREMNVQYEPAEA